jgi:transposase
MKNDRVQPQLFPDLPRPENDIVFINDRCRLRTYDGYCVASVFGIVVAHYPVGDRFGEAHAMVSLVEQGLALQTEVARAFRCDVRTVRRNQRRAEEGGLAALGRPGGYPKHRPRVDPSRIRRVELWKADGVSSHEIARRLGITAKAVRKMLRRLGWKEPAPKQALLPFPGGDPNLSAPSGLASKAVPEKDREQALRSSEHEKRVSAQAHQDGDPNPSAPSDVPDDLPISLDADPEDRRIDRLLACLGALDDAAPLFGRSAGVQGVGVLLAIPALLESGVLDVAREIYGSLGPAFYGLRTTLVTLLLMALLRVRRPEGLKEHSPRDLGRVLGLDRAPEMKTLRLKLARLAAAGRAASLGRALAQRRVAARGRAMGFLYVDGHVRVYHGKHSLPKAHVARMRISMPATTDYWVNDAEGEPLFVVPTEANPSLVSTLPPILEEVRRLVGERRVTVVFDRGGWSPKLFQKLIEAGFDILTYRKGRFRRVARKHFAPHEAILNGQGVRYVLADQGVRLRSGLRLRQVTRLAEDGHQTPIVTSRRDLSTVEVAYRMFSRWRQENFFKYLREEYALDALVDYDVEPADTTREVPNPARAGLDAQLRKARSDFRGLLALYGMEALANPESLRRTMRGFKIANAQGARGILAALKRVTDLERRRAAIPARVPLRIARPDEVVKLAVERKHLTNLLKMVAYQAESDLVRMLAPRYRRAEDEGRTLIQNALAQAGDISVEENELRLAINPLSSPHRTRALVALCENLNETRTCFPGSALRLRFEVKPSPKCSPAFPGPRSAQPRRNERKPDISRMG